MYWVGVAQDTDKGRALVNTEVRARREVHTAVLMKIQVANGCWSRKYSDPSKTSELLVQRRRDIRQDVSHHGNKLEGSITWREFLECPRNSLTSQEGFWCLEKERTEIFPKVCKKFLLISPLLNNIYIYRHSVCLWVLFVYFCVCNSHNRTIYKPVSIKRTVRCYRTGDKGG
jgi:hypothetical protein